MIRWRGGLSVNYYEDRGKNDAETVATFILVEITSKIDGEGTTLIKK
jgi:hypothetical protein